jgi:hypothetical protein
MKKRPILLIVVSVGAILLGLLSTLASGGYLVATYINQGAVYVDLEIKIVIQLILSIAAIVSGIGLLRRNEKARKSLNIIYWLVLLYIPWWAATDTVIDSLNPDQKFSYILNYIIFFLPIVFSIYYLHTKPIKEYFVQNNT